MIMPKVDIKDRMGSKESRLMSVRTRLSGGRRGKEAGL